MTQKRERGIGMFGDVTFDPQTKQLMGTPQQVAEKIHAIITTLGITRFVAHMDIGGPIHEDTIRSIELYAKEVTPKITKVLEK